jgi:hypothetical protein
MSPDRRLDVLAGIETGVLGGLAMLLCFALLSPLLGHGWWLIPNLLASKTYSLALLNPGFATVVGIATVLFGAGIVGVVNGVLHRGGRLFGLALAAAWYLFCYLFVWKRLAPLMLVHAPQPVVVAGFFVYGSILGYHPQLRRSLDH